MRWPKPNPARLPLCERRPDKQQFGRAKRAQSGVENGSQRAGFVIPDSAENKLNPFSLNPAFCRRSDLRRVKTA